VCEDDYGQVLEEYRGLVESLFELVLDRLKISERQLYEMKLANERREQEESMKKMLGAMK